MGSGVARLMIPAGCVIVGLFCWFAVRTVIGDFNKWDRAYPECPEGSECRQLAKLFSNDYSEMKDLAKSFLTLLVGVFVASITFSEKIVDAMISCWVSLLLAIVACGTGLVYLVIAYGMSVYAPESNYRFHEGRAVELFIASGISFGVGLCTMLLAGLNTSSSRHRLLKCQPWKWWQTSLRQAQVRWILAIPIQKPRGNRQARFRVLLRPGDLRGPIWEAPLAAPVV